MERLQKVLAASGIASRRKAEELIKAGRVRVDGVTITSLGYKVSGSEDIKVDGKPIQREEKVVYIFNKPKNVITSMRDEVGRPCVGDYFQEVPYRLFPVGRLDFASSGLLIMTNDGDITNKIIHPRHQIPKTYEVTVIGNLSIKEISKLKKGVILDDGHKTGKADIYYHGSNPEKNSHRYTITIYEGHNREIRRMFEVFACSVIRLHRIKEANIELGNLKSGVYRRLKIHEVKMLRQYLDDFSRQ